MRTTAKQYAKT